MNGALLTLALIGAISSGLLVSDAFAAVDMFIKIPDIDGEAQHSGEDGWIQVESLQWGFDRSINAPTSSSARESSSPSVSEVTVTKLMDSTSTVLMFESCCGSSKTVEIDLLTTASDGQQQFYMIELEKARITSYSMSGDGEQASESLSLNFEKINWKYQSTDPTKPDGSFEISKKPGHR